MEVRVYEEKRVEDKKQEFFLRLVQWGESVGLVLVNLNGIEVTGGKLLRIKRDMKLYRYGSVNDTLGLPLDIRDRLELTELDN